MVATGTEEEIKKVPESITGQYLSGEKKIPVPQTRRVSNGKWLEVKGARANNLRNIDVRFPLGVFICVTGVSGSGKSTLVNEILYRRLSMELHRSHMKPKEHDALLGLEHLDKVINVDRLLSGVHRVQIRPHIQVCLIISVNYFHVRRRHGHEVINRAASVLTLKAAGVKPVAVTAFCALKCTSCLMFMCPVKSAAVSVTTVKLWKSVIKENIADILNMTVAEALEFLTLFRALK